MALSSMTGFGTASATEGQEHLVVEVKSVNGKFCEVKARLPRELAALEGEVVRVVKDRVARGSIDVSVRRSSVGGSQAVPVVDVALVAAAAQALREAARAAGLPDQFSIGDLLRIEGLVRVEDRSPDAEAAGRALRAALEGALGALQEVRRREGQALEADLRARVDRLRQLSTEAARLAAVSVDQFRERLRRRVEEIAPDIAADPRRLEQEVVLFADRTDVTEEATRLAVHLAEFDRLISRAGPVGRQLDFLVQEIHREVNTTGSKSQSAEVARIVVDLKAEAERIREQVQNVE